MSVSENIKVLNNGDQQIDIILQSEKNLIRVQSVVEGELVEFTINQNVQQTFEQLSEQHFTTLSNLLYDVYLAKCG